MAVPAEIRELTERFERTKDAYRSPQYNETQLRREFLDPLNSWLITWRHHRRSPKAKKALFPKVLVSDLKHIPVPKLSPTNPADKSRHDQTVRLVEQMLELHQRLAAARTP